MGLTNKKWVKIRCIGRFPFSINTATSVACSASRLQLPFEARTDQGSNNQIYWLTNWRQRSIDPWSCGSWFTSAYMMLQTSVPLGSMAGLAVGVKYRALCHWRKGESILKHFSLLSTLVFGVRLRVQGSPGTACCAPLLLTALLEGQHWRWLNPAATYSGWTVACVGKVSMWSIWRENSSLSLV